MLKTKKYRILLAFLILASQLSAVQPEVDNFGFPTPGLERITGKVVSQPIEWRPYDFKGNEAWQAFRYEHGGIALAVGKPFSLNVNSLNDEEISKSILGLVEKIADDLNMKGYEFEIENLKYLDDALIVMVKPTFQKVDIYGGFVVVGLDRFGRVSQIKAQGYGKEFEGSFQITWQDAFLYSTNLFKRRTLELEQASRIWLPYQQNDGTSVLKACWMVDIDSDEPGFRPTVFVEAQSGAILAVENRVQYERLDGQVLGRYKPRYAGDSLRQDVFPYERVDYGQTTVYGDREGRFFFEVNQNLAPFDIRTQLRGRWVDVNWEDGPDANMRIQVRQIAPFTMIWTEQNSRDDERSLYYHVNFIHSFWKALDPGFNGMDWAVPATCCYGDNYDNAFWNGQGIFFGDGGEMDNFALYCDIVYHEYGHGVTSYIYPRGMLPYEGESGALNEAWSDYFPCSVTNEPLMGEGGLVPNGYIRNLDNNLVYPRDIVNEVHMDSRIISAAMWHTRQILGQRYCDSLFHFARYRLGNNFLSHFTDILFTDDNDNDITNGTRNYEVLYQQFGRHGIGPGLTAKFALNRFELFDDVEQGASGNGNYIWEPGETVRIDYEVERLGVLYPPPARNVIISITCDNPYIEILTSAIGLGDMWVGNRIRTPSPILFNIRDDAELSFANLMVEITAEGIPQDLRFRDTLRIPVGRPVLGLIKDGNAPKDYTFWFNLSLDSLGLVYSTVDVYEPRAALSEQLSHFRTVVWFTGDAQDGILRDLDRQALIQFMCQGGNVLLTGQSAGMASNSESFFRDYFGARTIIDSVRQRSILGLSGDPVAQGFRLLLLGGFGAMNQNRPMGIEAVNGGVEIYHWATPSWQPLEIAAGVRYENRFTGSRTVYLAFGAEAVGGHGPINNRTNTRSQVLGAALDWLGVPNYVSDENYYPTTFEIGAPYPNPFNGLVNIPININYPSLISVMIWNINGQLVYNQKVNWNKGSQVITVDAKYFTSGTYFCRIEAPSGSSTKKLLILK